MIFGKNNTLERYRAIRIAGRGLNTELFSVLKKPEILIAGSQYGIVRKQALVVESQELFDRFTDYAINDYYSRTGENAVQRYRELNQGAVGEIDDAILQGLLASESSLFEIVGKGEGEGEVLFHDLLNERALIPVTDEALSTSVHRVKDAFILFSRILEVDGIIMTSGAAYLYGKDSAEVLAAKYKAMMKKVPFGNDQTKLTIAFHKLHQRYGSDNLEYR